MWTLSIFRIIMVLGFFLSAWRWGDWKNWEKYYPSMLFVMVVNLTFGYVAYNHPLWIFNQDAIVKNETIVEFVNTYVALSLTTLIYLSQFPRNGFLPKLLYMLWWVFIYGSLEFIDAKITGGISYDNGWSWVHSVLFDCVMFPTIRIHYVSPFWGWVISIISAIFILIVYDFRLADMK